MNTDFVIFALAIFMLFVGWLFAFITYRRKLIALRKLMKQNHIDSLQEQYEEYQRGYRNGWDDGVNSIMTDPALIRSTCNQYFHTHQP